MVKKFKISKMRRDEDGPTSHRGCNKQGESDDTSCE